MHEWPVNTWTGKTFVGCAIQMTKVQIFMWVSFMAYYLPTKFGLNQQRFGGVVFLQVAQFMNEYKMDYDFAAHNNFAISKQLMKMISKGYPQYSIISVIR